MLDIYFGDSVETIHGEEIKWIESYRFKNMTCLHRDAFMGLHFINNPLFEMYALSDGNKYNTSILIEEAKKRRQNVSNEEFKNDYLVMTEVQMEKYSEITSFYD